MTSKDKRSKQMVIWTILGVLVSIVAVIVMVMAWRRPQPDRDFVLAVTPMRGVSPQGGVTQTTISVKGEGGYEHSVSLSAAGQPPDVLVAFSPPFGIAAREFTSTMMVNVGPKVSAGDCTITIKGVGADGREHSCKYTLTVAKGDGPPPPPPHPLIVRITSPKRDEEVPISLTATGTISGDVPGDRYIWVLANPHSSPGQWWPQPGPVEPWAGGWTVSVRLGREEEDKGNEFDIAVILVNEEGNQQYKTYFETAEAMNDFPGGRMPSGAAMLDRITVKRK